jgi:hypothetical protein
MCLLAVTLVADLFKALQSESLPAIPIYGDGWA